MYVHFAAKRLLYRFPLLGRIYAQSSIRRAIRTLFFRITSYVPIVYVELTSICNAACIFCPYPVISKSGKKLQAMLPSTFDVTVERIREARVQFVNMTPTTGEILASPFWDTAIAQIAGIPTVRRVHFYSNGILLSADSQRRLLRIADFEKLALSFSTGGASPEQYKRLFGVDRFAKVRANLRRLFAALAERNARIPVSVEVRLGRDDPALAISEVARVYGVDQYRWGGVNIRRIYDPIGGIVNDSRLDYSVAKIKRKPCQLLGDTRFAADGSVWVCGCAVSEQPGDTSLRIGRHDSPAAEIAANRQRLVADWAPGNIPKPCLDCASYYLPFKGWDPDARPMFDDALRERRARDHNGPANSP